MLYDICYITSKPRLYNKENLVMLPELSRDERAWASVKFEQIPLFYPRGCAAPLRGIAAIATLERFVVYCSCEQTRPRAQPWGHSSCYSILNLYDITNKYVPTFKFQMSWAGPLCCVGRTSVVYGYRASYQIILFAIIANSSVNFVFWWPKCQRAHPEAIKRPSLFLAA